ncbi:MAG: class I adenylate-forming enzyme family protein [Arenicellales bacterium]|nr:class I adenylate-forming enzyme family protein [Arenicellales bacterium]
MYDVYQETWNTLTGPDTPFEVVEIEVRNSTMRVYKNAPLSLREIWLSSLIHAERDYLVYGDEHWTYAEVHVQVASIANWMADQGIKSGDRVAISMRNYPEWLMIYWACVSTGVAVVGMNAWWVEDEMAYGLADSSPKVLFCDEERLNRFLNIRDKFAGLATVSVRLEESRSDTIDFAEVLKIGGELPDISVDPDQDACIFYTSGTTGYPKGAQLTHRGCIHNIMNMSFGGQLALLTSCKMNNLEPPDPKDAQPMIALVTTPLFHVAANNCLAHPATRGGGKLVLMYRWDAGEALKLIEAERITILSGVPVMARELINHPDFDKYDTSTLRSVSGGGAQVQPDLVERIDKAVGTARPSTGYGMTETCGGITSIVGDFFIDKPESCGPAMPAFEIKVVDVQGKTLPQGEAGELWIRGAAVIKGYINQEEATAETITDGWLHSGDIARIDEHGFIFLVDRVKDMVLRGGENVYCSEVEAVLHRLDEIAECSVFGVEDDRLGEEVGASIFLTPGAEISANGIREFCLAHMAKHKLPRYIWFSPEPLPRNASGKFLKRELRDTLNVADAV